MFAETDDMRKHELYRVFGQAVPRLKILVVVRSFLRARGYALAAGARPADFSLRSLPDGELPLSGRSMKTKHETPRKSATRVAGEPG